MSHAADNLSKILRTSPETLLLMDQKLLAVSGKQGILDKIDEANQALVKSTLEDLGLAEDEFQAGTVYSALVKRLIDIDTKLYNSLDKPDLLKMSETCGKLCDAAVAVNQPQPGFFIKHETALTILEKYPPHNLLNFFGYSSVQELVEKEGFSSVFGALRFAQDTKWMHEYFEQGLALLTPEDFEVREVEIKVLEPQWLNVAEKFLEKKYHNVSHLKELGIVFIIPLKIDTPGETLRLFTLLLHYLNEVPFYSKLFKRYALKPDFVVKVKSLLRGDVPAGPAPEGSFRIIQRYLAKDDPEDFRLKEPHFNPEAEHWYKAEGNLAGAIQSGQHSWQEIDFVGSFFPSAQATAGTELVSFDLIDLVMTLVKKGQVKYLYHQQEALWNRIFIEHLGRDRMEQLVEKNIIEGFIKL